MKTNCLVCLCLFLLLPSLAIGDIAPNRVSAPNLSPLSSTSVRMVSEVVTVDLYKDSSTVEVLFEMKNLGETEIVEVGFPIMDFYFGWKTSLFVGQNSEGDRFKVWVDDQPVEDIKIYGFDFQEVSSQEKSIAHKKQDILKEDSLLSVKMREANRQSRQLGVIVVASKDGSPNVRPWYIWNTTFPKGETRWIKVRYSLPKGTNKRNDFFNYVLHTGANWSETIGKATIKVNIHDIPDQDIWRITPAGYTKEENTISWTLTDFEPTVKDDIFVYYRKEYVEPWRESSDVYLDNKKTDINLIIPEDIAYFRVEKADTLNFPDGAIFICTKEFDFALLKELVRKVSPGNFKELAALEVDEFYSNYEVKIAGGETKRGESFHDLSVDDVASITIEHTDDRNRVVITKQ
ncbi:hypothetical protein [uncultured Proteiniphilum sp.]|uniref:hypothetical protein n=1 Tax=uncultured Proteiniphilum sp. TaxID=497637 RepID=UPI00262933DB|nr:hypothetical protein [uncultured Proteiniphilum sp.]